MIDQCRVCGASQHSSLHRAAEACIDGRKPCDYPQEHHEFQPLTEAEWRQRLEEEYDQWSLEDVDTLSPE